MPRLQVFLSHSVHSSGARLGGTSAHEEPPPAIPLMIFMTIGGEWTGSHAGLPLNLDWVWAVGHHTPSVCMFSWRPKCQIPVLGHRSSLWISLNPICQGGCAPFHPHKQASFAIKGLKLMGRWCYLPYHLSPERHVCIIYSFTPCIWCCLY